MKVLIVFVLLVAMSVFIYKQQNDISDLRSSLADEQAKSAQLQTDLENAKKALAAKAAQAQAQAAYTSPLSPGAPAPAPAPAASPATNWMWSTKSPLDAPAKSK